MFLDQILKYSFKQHGDRSAIRHGSHVMTYLEFDKLTNQYANYFLSLGIKENDIVGLCLERSIEQIACLVGLLKIGAAYLPLDAEYPVERLEYMVSFARAKLIITEKSLLNKLPKNSTSIKCLDEISLATVADDELLKEVSLNEKKRSVYIIFTSGSTGTPKAVDMGGGALSNLLEWHKEEDAKSYKTLQFSPISFDVHFQEIFTTLMNGGELVLIDETKRLNTALLLEFIQKENIERLFLPYVALNQLCEVATEYKIFPESLKVITTAGEQLKITEKIRSFFLAIPALNLYNHYGPSESHVVTSLKLSDDPRTWPNLPSIGFPIKNALIKVFDEHLKEVKEGISGEMFIGGDVLANGYLHDEVRTKERFIVHPELGMIYKTGDRAKVNHNGEVIYEGRLDGQVKIRGYRIETGEVEIVLNKIKGIKEAAVKTLDLDNDLILCGYYIGDLKINEIREELKEILPDYMIPTHFVKLTSMPLTPSGKLDYKKLPIPTTQRPDLSNAFIAPESELEISIGKTWQKYLKIDQIGVEDNFFDIGGTSLLAIKIMIDLNEKMPKKISIAELFNKTTIALLTQYYLEDEVEFDDFSDFDSQNTESKDIAVIAMTGRFPNTNSIEEFWENIKAAKDCLNFFDKKDINPFINKELSDDENYVLIEGLMPDYESFDHKYFGYNPRVSELMDPQQRKMLELSVEAIEKAGYFGEHTKERVGVFLGSGNSLYPKLVNTHPEKIKQIGEFNTMLGLEKDYISTRVAYELNLKGPALSIHTACSTSLVAIIEAVKSLRNGECHLALAGGVAISGQPHSGHLFQEGGILSQDGKCRSFDKDATGTIFTDGAGVVVLKRKQDAIRDGDQILAVIKGVGLNNDGRDKMSFTAPSINGQASAIMMAQKDANVDASLIGFIEAHATATPIGDPIEIAALKKAFSKTSGQKNHCYLGALKSNYGHLTAAAVVESFMKAVMCVNEGVIPGVANLSEINPNLEIEDSPFSINKELVAFPKLGEKRIAGVSSFGVGGTNAHIIIEEYQEVRNQDLINNEKELILFKLSAKNEVSLKNQLSLLKEQLKKSAHSEWGKIAYTLEVGRKKYSHRTVIVAKDIDDLENKNEIIIKDDRKNNLVFLYPGQGSQYSSMGKDLYENNSLFRDFMDQAFDVANKYLDYNLEKIMFETSKDFDYSNTYYSQPAIFVIEYALAKTLETLGISASISIGHSLGEFVSAAVNGVFSLQDAMRLVCTRAKLMSDLPKGKMCSVSVSLEDAQKLAREFDLDVSVYNHSLSCVIAGEREKVDAMIEKLKVLDVAFVELKTSHAFHSRMMNVVVDKFLDVVKNVEMKIPKNKMISSVTGKLETELFTKPEYWANHLNRPVVYYNCIETLLEGAQLLAIEIGPKNTLINLLKKEAVKKKKTDVKTIQVLDGVKERESYTFLKLLGTLWSYDFDVSDLNLLYRSHFKKRVPTVTYQFEKIKHWPNMRAEMPNKELREIMTNTNQLIKEKIISIFEESSGIDIAGFSEDTSFVSMGMDSLFLTQIALDLKKEFKVNLNFRQLMESYASLDQLLKHLSANVTLDKYKENQSAKVVPQQGPSKEIENISIDTRAVEIKETITAPAVQTINSVMMQPAQNFLVNTPPTNDLQSVVAMQIELMSKQLQLLSGQGVSALSIQPQMSQQAHIQVKEEVKKAAEQKVVEEKKSQTNKVSNLKSAFGAQARIEVEKNRELANVYNDKVLNFFNEYIEKTKGSKNFTQKNRKNHADPRAVTGFKPESKEITYPIVIKRSKMQTLWDVDNNKYIDMICGFGSNFFGNGNEFIKKYVINQIEEGIELGPQHPLVEDVSNLVNELTGNERTAFCNTGSEAVIGAMRIARTVSGKDKIVVFSGSYHGINDEVILRAAKSGKSLPAAPGICSEAVSNMIVLDYGTDETLQKIRELGDEIAAVLVEPVQSRRSDFHPTAFLKELRSITEKNDVCLIFDEIITGFRVHPAGAQGYFGVRADLCTYGKIIGGGMPIGVISGKTKYMDALDGGHWQYGDDSTPTVGVTYFAGTFVRHPLALAAAKASLIILKEQGEKGLTNLFNKAQRFVDEINQFFAMEQAPIELNNFGPLLKPKWKEDINGGEVLFAILRYKGIHVYDGFPWFVNLAHKDEELAQVVLAVKESVYEMQKLGIFMKPASTQGGPVINLDVFEQVGAPMLGAKLGRDEDGNPAWYMEDPDHKGQYYKIKGQ